MVPLPWAGLGVRRGHPCTVDTFLVFYNSVATDQKLFIFGVGVPGRALFHSSSMNHWVMPQGGAKDKNLGHPNKVVYCSFLLINKKDGHQKCLSHQHSV